jgi:hypothetical protein
VTYPDLNAVSGSPCDWLGNSATLLCQFVDANRGPVPQPPTVPSGPNIQENVGKAVPVSTSRIC